MPKARRRTLNHCDIDNFLSEISTVADSKPQKFVDEVIATPSLPPEQPKQKDEASLIRDYCKICFRDSKIVSPTSKSKSVQSIAKSVFELSEYKLIASRLLSPEQFNLPPTSIEAKKSLILSLAPMLTAAEEHRKKEAQECEDFTRCKSAKGRGRSNYEYTDIDTAQVVSYEEFETRYLKYINKDKVVVSKKITPAITPRIIAAQVPTNAVTQTPVPTPTPVIMEADKENVVNQVIPTRSKTEKAADGTAKERKRKLTNGTHDRRGTLSPTSARAMFLSAVEDDSNLVAPSTQPVAQQQSPVPAPKPSVSPLKPVTNTTNVIPVSPMNLTAAQPAVTAALPIDIDFMNTDDLFWGNPFPTSTTATMTATTDYKASNGILDAPVDLLGLDMLDMMPPYYTTTTTVNTASTLFPNTLQVIDDWMANAGDVTKLQTIEHRLSRSSSGKWTDTTTTSSTSAEENVIIPDVVDEFAFIDALEPVVMNNVNKNESKSSRTHHHHKHQKPRRESFSYEGILELTECISNEDQFHHLMDVPIPPSTANKSMINTTMPSSSIAKELLDLTWTPPIVPNMPTVSSTKAPHTTSSTTKTTPIPIKPLYEIPTRVNLQEQEQAAMQRREERRKQIELQYHWEVISGQAVNKAIDRMITKNLAAAL